MERIQRRGSPFSTNWHLSVVIQEMRSLKENTGDGEKVAKGRSPRCPSFKVRLIFTERHDFYASDFPQKSVRLLWDLSL